jgi:hypothetical protein
LGGLACFRGKHSAFFNGSVDDGELFAQWAVAAEGTVLDSRMYDAKFIDVIATLESANVLWGPNVETT